MSDIAYAKRDVDTIKKRRRAYLFFLTLRKIARVIFRTGSKQVTTITTFPAITSPDELKEIINKLAWAFPYKDDLTVSVLVEKGFVHYEYKKEKAPNGQRDFMHRDTSHIRLTSRFDSSSDLVFLTKARSLYRINPLLLHKIEIFDKEYFSTVEGRLLLGSYFRTFSLEDKKVFETASKRNFTRMLERNKEKEKAYCYVTGPSFDRYKEFVFEDNTFKVICNSIVKNEDFLAYIGKPDLLVFADPVFHFGPSEYSAVFRDHVVRVVKRYQCFVAVPESTVPLIVAHCPSLQDYVIGMPGHSGDFNFPSLENFWVRNSGNILTYFMLPIASALCREIYVIGADGRQKNEKYFWKHSSSAQFDELMQSVFETHPSFFRDQDYEDYYDKHCEFFEDLVLYGENRGKIYRSLTPSHIPALSKRGEHK